MRGLFLLLAFVVVGWLAASAMVAYAKFSLPVQVERLHRVY